MSNELKKISATITSLEREHWEKDTEFTNTEAYAASSLVTTKTIHGAYDGTTTVFQLDEPLANGLMSYATPNNRVFELCSDAKGEKCVLGFDEHDELKLVELGDVSVSLSRRVGAGWVLVFVAVAVVIAVLMAMVALS